MNILTICKLYTINNHSHRLYNKQKTSKHFSLLSYERITETETTNNNKFEATTSTINNHLIIKEC